MALGFRWDTIGCVWWLAAAAKSLRDAAATKLTFEPKGAHLSHGGVRLGRTVAAWLDAPPVPHASGGSTHPHAPLPFTAPASCRRQQVSK